ncbi:MAG: hypothetical protein ABJH68_16235 [Ilumatobacter sp.]|uniref:hypothetical protein n=1 Tax=Ilumatobacter sp. TaxID=1967498 RepID=UPI003299E343
MVRLLAAHPELSPNDVVFLCEQHRDGIDAVHVIEDAGHAVHHIFSENKNEQQRRKQRFWPDAPGVKGCTVHSFKGWETRVLVMGIRADAGSKRLAYVAMTRLKTDSAGGQSFISILNSNLKIAPFQSTFEHWAVPQASSRVG